MTCREGIALKLPFKIKSLEDVAEPYRELYVEQDDGTYTLDVEDLPAPDPPGGDLERLQGTIDRERDLRRKLEKQLKTLKGLDPEKYKELLKLEEELKEEKAAAEEERKKKAGEWEALKPALIKEHDKALAAAEKQHEEALKALQERYDRLSTAYDTSLIEQEMTRALSKVNGNVTLMAPHIRPLLTVEHDEKTDTREVVVIDADGQVRKGKRGAAFTPDDLVKEFRERPEFKSEDLFPTETEEGGSGAGEGEGDGTPPKASDKEALSTEAWIEEAMEGED